MNQPNILMDVHDHFRHMILDCEWFVDPIIACVNPAKHQTFMTFSTVDQLHAHVKDCLGFKDKLSLIERKRKEDRSQLNQPKVIKNIYVGTLYIIYNILWTPIKFSSI